MTGPRSDNALGEYSQHILEHGDGRLQRLVTDLDRRSFRDGLGSHLVAAIDVLGILSACATNTTWLRGKLPLVVTAYLSTFSNSAGASPPERPPARARAQSPTSPHFFRMFKMTSLSRIRRSEHQIESHADIRIVTALTQQIVARGY